MVPPVFLSYKIRTIPIPSIIITWRKAYEIYNKAFYFRAEKNLGHTNTWIWMFMAALFIKVKKWKQPKCPFINESINKMLYPCNGIFFNHKNEVLIHTTVWVYLENIILRETGQPQKATYVWFYLHQMSRIDKPIEIKSRLMVFRCQGVGWGLGGARNNC